jgi:hypothetical protein
MSVPGNDARDCDPRQPARRMPPQEVRRPLNQNVFPHRCSGWATCVTEPHGKRGGWRAGGNEEPGLSRSILGARAAEALLGRQSVSPRPCGSNPRAFRAEMWGVGTTGPGGSQNARDPRAARDSSAARPPVHTIRLPATARAGAIWRCVVTTGHGIRRAASQAVRLAECTASSSHWAQDDDAPATVMGRRP